MNKLWKTGAFVIMVLSILVTSAGCASEQRQASTPTKVAYADLLLTDYENALDTTNQLALGTLRLEETAQAVDETQAAALLPLWQAMINGVSESDNEIYAVTKQLIAAMTDAQIEAITVMQLTQDDLTTWMQEHSMAAPGAANQGIVAGGGTGGANADRAVFREQSRNMSEEERTALREELMAQFGDSANSDAVSMPGIGRAGRTPAGGGVYAAVISLLAERSGSNRPTRLSIDNRPTEEAETEEIIETQESEQIPGPASTILPESTQTPTPEVEDSSDPEGTESKASSLVSAVTVPETPSTGTVEETVTVVSVAILEQIPDTDPAPPLSVSISQNGVTANPNYEGGSIYTVTGWVTNESSDVYVVQAVNVTFYDADGFRGAFYPFPRSGGRGQPSGEYIWHGVMQADIACGLLAPGAGCPFSAEIAAQNMASFLVHPDADLVEWHEPASATVVGSSITAEGNSFYVIRGTVTNTNDYAIGNVLVIGTLYNVAGAMTSIGSAYVIPAVLEAGASAGFEVHIARDDYTHYELAVQAEGAFD